jgi:hypothetical protein
MLPVRADSREGVRVGATRQVILGFLLIAAVLGVSAPAYPLDDVLGWQNTRWGMTQAEVRRCLESLGLPLTPLPASYERVLGAGAPFKTSVEMAGNHYDGIFLFPDDTTGLGRVLISTVDFSHEHALMLHGNLLRALTEKYGRPGKTESQGSMASQTWVFKTTTVVLSMYTDTAVRNNHVTHVAVIYVPTAAASEDAQQKLLGLGLLRALGEVGRGAR